MKVKCSRIAVTARRAAVVGAAITAVTCTEAGVTVREQCSAAQCSSPMVPVPNCSRIHIREEKERERTTEGLHQMLEEARGALEKAQQNMEVEFLHQQLELFRRQTKVAKK